MNKTGPALKSVITKLGEGNNQHLPCTEIRSRN